MPIVLGNIFEVLGQVAVIGGGMTFIVYHAFKYLARTWLEAKVKESLQNLVHEQNKELERLKSSLTRSFDRAARMHTREFDVLPDVWDRVDTAYWAVMSVVSPIQSYPDFAHMTPEQTEAFILACPLQDWEKEELRASGAKNHLYMAKISWFKVQQAKSAVRNANSSLSKNGIFITDGVRGKADTLMELLWGAVVEEEVNIEDRPAPRLKEDIGRLRNEGESLRSALESEVRQRLWAHEKDDLA